MNKSIRDVEKLYNNRIESSKDAVQAAGQWGEKEFVPLICNEISKKIRIKKTDKVLELGCGSGVLGNWLMNQVDFYVGIDISFKMLQFFKNDINKNENSDVFHGITQQIPFQDNIFDLIIINGVTMYFDKKELFIDTLKEMKRVAKNDATLFLGENITSEVYPYEFVWFNNLNLKQQIFAKQYIKIRKYFSKYDKLAGKWKNSYNTISLANIKSIFNQNVKISKSYSSAYTIKQKMLGKHYKGNRRIDFVIELLEESD